MYIAWNYVTYIITQFGHIATIDTCEIPMLHME
jgi:hypothetical protein